jgi:hypothetical protein
MSGPLISGDAYMHLSNKDEPKVMEFVESLGRSVLRPIRRKCERRNHLSRLHGLCQLVGAEFQCREDAEGSGDMSIAFPKGQGWTLKSAEDYVLRVLKLDLCCTDGGAGRYFAQANGYLRNGHEDHPVFHWRWGYDI